MNFLAHIYLSGDSVDLMHGNFIGDGVKGKQIEQYHPEVQKGIQLHRFIDHFTDNHVIPAEMRSLIRPHFRKYSGVVLDIYFDYYLGTNWNKYHNTPLPEYVARVHQTLDSFETQMPRKSQYFFKYMKIHNWLLNYCNPDALELIFKGMASRTSFDSNMERAVEVLQEHNDDLSRAFEEFFPELEKATQRFILKLR
jgi:acyl carrier protein phosphodiesterase